MIAIAGIFFGKDHPVNCIEPHVRPLVEHVGGGSTIRAISDCIQHIQEISDVINERIPQIGPGAGDATLFTYTKDIAILDVLHFEGEYTCTLKPQQLLRVLCQYYKLLTLKEPSLMEVEILSYKPYPEEYPIPPEIRALPIIKLTDLIPLPSVLS